MKALKIKGGNKLSGEIEISSAKNSAVALIPAAVLANDIITINNVPDISDVDALSEILTYLGADIKRDGDSFIVDPTKIQSRPLTESISKKLRASYYFMGVLLAKFKKVEMYFPGGCPIGERPIDLHLKGFEALGATIKIKKNKYTVEAKELIGAHIYLDKASVGATLNIMFAATLAKGVTIIENPAREPEIVNIATYLNNIGAKISGAGTREIKIEGIKNLEGGFLEVIPDRIEAGTYIIAGALLGDNLKIKNIIPKHIESLTSKLEEIGVNLEIGDNYCIVNKSENLKPTRITTLPYPGFPTDLQQPITALLIFAKGKSKIEETIYESRCGHITYLNKMGAKIEKKDNEHFIITGIKEIKGKKVRATDLRGGATMVLAGLAAKGETIVKDIEHVLRGYEKIVEKLKKVGADIEIIDI